MTKIRRLSGFQHSFTFSSQTEQFDVFFSRFMESDLGKICIAVPWDELVSAFKLEEPKKGPRSIFSAKCKLALMFLKHYGGLPPEKDKGAHQGHRDSMDILRHPYGQRAGDRQTDIGHGTGKGGLGNPDPK